MSRRSQTPKSAVTLSLAATLFIALAAFAMGAGVMWMCLRSSPAGPPPSGTFATTPLTGEQPPDVSQLAPAEAATTLGNWNYDRQNWPHALEHYEQAIALGRDNADIRTDLGNCYRFMAQPLKALEQYSIAQRWNPEHENSLVNTAALYSEVIHDPVKAAATWREYLRRFPNAAGVDRARRSLAKAEQHQATQTDLLKQYIIEGGPKRQP